MGGKIITPQEFEKMQREGEVDGIVLDMTEFFFMRVLFSAPVKEWQKSMEGKTGRKGIIEITMPEKVWETIKERGKLLNVNISELETVFTEKLIHAGLLPLQFVFLGGDYKKLSNFLADEMEKIVEKEEKGENHENNF